MPNLNLFLLGSPHIALDDQPLEISRRKAIALLSYLAVSNDHSQQRDRLATLLWPDYDQRRARAALRSALWALNKSPVGEWLVVEPEVVTLKIEAEAQIEAVWLDVAHFRHLLKIVQNHNHTANEVCPTCLAALEEAVALYRDDFLAGFTLPDAPDFDEWQFFQSENLRQDLTTILESLTQHHCTQGDFVAAIPYARRQLSLNPLHEPAHRTLMQLYARAGQQAAALRQYQRCQETLAAELGLPPSDEITALYESIRSGIVSQRAEENSERVDDQPISRPNADVEPTAQDKQPEVAHNLPRHHTPFIGREPELKALADLIANPDVQLITIVGQGGMGKTRLAITAAEAQLARSPFAQGVYFVSLAPLADPEAIIPAIAEVVGYPFQGDGRSPQQQLLDYFQQRQLLLLLDNFEHLLGETPHFDVVEFVAAMLQTAPQVKILVTSRERLNLHQEQLYPLHGLSFPSPQTTEAVTDTAAADLFLQSARRTQPDFAVAPKDLPHLTTICNLVEGMPLGLELAASWVDTLSLANIVAEIQKSIDFLETDVRNIPARHRSMRAVFDTSWQQLSEAEQHIFAQLSLFRGGFTRDAVSAVTGASLRTLATLVNKSLLRYNQSQDRYEIHELLRQYAAEHLAQTSADQIVAARSQHAAYYSRLLQQRNADLKGPQPQVALNEIGLELGNMQMAWRWAVEQGQVERLDQAMDSLGLFFDWRARYPEGEAIYRLAVEKLPKTVSGDGQRTVSKLLTWQALFSHELGQSDLADQLELQSLALLDNPAMAAYDTRQARAFLYWVRGERLAMLGDEAAEAVFSAGLTLCREIDDQWGAAQALNALGWLTGMAGRIDEMTQLTDECLAIRRKIEDRRGLAQSLIKVSWQSVAKAQYEDAEALARQAYHTYRQMGDQLRTLRTAHHLGKTLNLAGKFAESVNFMQQCLIDYPLKNDHRVLALIKAELGSALIHTGHYDQAWACADQCLTHLQQSIFEPPYVMPLLQQGQVVLAQDNIEQIQSLLQKLRSQIPQIKSRNWEVRAVLPVVGYLARAQDDRAMTHQQIRQNLQDAIARDAVHILGLTIPLAALTLVDRGENERAIELYALARQFPYVANSHWLERVAGQPIKKVTATLPAKVTAEAEARGRNLDLWETAQALLTEFPPRIDQKQ